MKASTKVAMNRSFLTNAIEMHQLERTYLSGPQAVRALRGINLTIPAGRFVALKGRSGSGKTTLLNCVGGLDRPTAGAVAVYGRDLSEMGEKDLTEWRRLEVGFIFQAFGLLPTLSAYENVELMLRLAKKPRAERLERALYCLDLVGLRKWADHRPHEMSGGQQQRVAIARALANAPHLILADEPTGELDSETSLEILELFQSLVQSQYITMLMATHDSLADEFVDEILLLKDGRIAGVGE